MSDAPAGALPRPIGSGVDPRRWVLTSSALAAAQRRHFLLSFVLPVVLALALPWIWPMFEHPGLAIVSFLLMGLLAGGLGISVGFHRLFAHRAFTATQRLRLACVVAGQMAAQGPVIYWVALHRRHHVFSDLPGDPHSPNLCATPGARSRLKTFLAGHVGWAWSHPVPVPSRYVPDLLADPLMMRASRAYWWCVGLGLLMPAVLGAAWLGSLEGAAIGLYWGGVMRLVVEHQTIWAINSVCHFFGSRPHDTPDNSRNNAWLALLSFGESWHNNHHHAPTSARFGDRPWQIDIGWWIIRSLQALGQVSHVRLPPADAR